MGNGGDERETDCQEVKKPTDSDHDEGMDGRGLGMACEKNREGGEEMENICSVYLLRSRMHDHNPPAVPQAFSAPPPSPCFLLYLSPSAFFPLSLFVLPLLLLPLSYHNMVSMALSQMLKSVRIGLGLH